MTLKNKQLHMVAYLLELGYELMHSAGMDVSTMPGFERFGLPNLNRKQFVNTYIAVLYMSVSYAKVMLFCVFISIK